MVVATEMSLKLAYYEIAKSKEFTVMHGILDRIYLKVERAVIISSCSHFGGT